MPSTSPMAGGSLGDQVAVITGAANGIGRAIAERFAAEGARVALVDQDEAGIQSTLDAISSAGGEAVSLVCDISEMTPSEQAVEMLLERWGRIDILVTSAGMSIGKTVIETSLEDWNRVMAVNVTGCFVWSRAVLPAMSKAGRGAIVMIASQVAIRGAPANAVYTTSKSALIGLTRSIAIDYGPQGIRANALMPGAILTSMQERFIARQADPDRARQRSLDSRPIKRFGTAEDVAAAALFLVSDASAYTTGTVLPVEGGALAQ